MKGGTDEVIPDSGLEYHKSLKKDVLPMVEVDVFISGLRSKYIGKHFVDDESGLL